MVDTELAREGRGKGVAVSLGTQRRRWLFSEVIPHGASQAAGPAELQDAASQSHRDATSDDEATAAAARRASSAGQSFKWQGAFNLTYNKDPHRVMLDKGGALRDACWADDVNVVQQLSKSR